MIRLDRSKQATPATLLTKGKKEGTKLKNQANQGLVDFIFSGKIYGATDVRSALRKIHHGKCAFCESLLPQTTAGHVEHFRPKGEVQQDVGKPLMKPGYYWLAYDWSNLLLACEWCNSRAKRRLFPLDDESKRCRSHRQKITRESPLLLDPSKDEPTKHLTFAEEYVLAKGGSRKGGKSIKVYRLDDPGLTEERRKKLALFRALRDFARHATPQPEVKDALAEARRWIRRIKNGKIEYTGMLRENL